MRIAMVLVAVIASTVYAVQRRDLSVYYGTERATLGAWFGSLALGTVDAPTLPPGQPGVTVALVRLGHRIDGVDLTIPADSCAELDRRLAQVWGPPNADPGDYGKAWASTSGLQAAWFEGDTGFDLPCRMRFFRRVTPQQWLNSSKQSVVPLWAIGSPARELDAAIAVLEPSHDQNQIEWHDTAIDGSHVGLHAEVDHGHVVRVLVSTEGTDTRQIWQRLLELYGTPDQTTTHEDSLTFRWHRAGVELDSYWEPMPLRVPITEPQPPQPTPTEPSGLPMSISFGR